MWIAAAAALMVSGVAHADALVDNVDGMTLDEKGAVVRFTGLLLSPDGKITKLLKRGDKRPEKLDWKADMKARVALPGMVDAHGHVMDMGYRALALDLSKTPDMADAKVAIATYAAANPNRPWLTGSGWNAGWPTPTLAELDAVTGDHPTWLKRADGNAGWANSAALKTAGVTAKTLVPAGGRIEGGIFFGPAMALIEKALPAPTPRDRNAAFLKAQEMLLSQGVTAAADLGTTLDDWQTYRRMGDLNLLRVRIMSYARGVDMAIVLAGQGPTPWLYGDRLRMGGIRLTADGVLAERTAWLKAPYADAPTVGRSMLSDDQLLNLMSRGAMDGFQIAVDATGDRAVNQVLNAIDELSDTYNGDRRWRIEAAAIVDPADLPRLRTHGVVLSMRPARPMGQRAMIEARIGPARMAGAYIWKSVLANGGSLVFGADSPIESVNPWVGWASGFTRQDAGGQPFGGWRPEEALTREQAWRTLSIDAARAGFAEDRFGRLAPGLRADFVIVDRDPLLASPEELRGTQVLETWVGGEQVWKRK